MLLLESESEESESSSSEEEEEGSMDSRDIGPIRLDPNVCPEGCDPEIYEKTYDLRNTRSVLFEIKFFMKVAD